jgi:hypothetical protein
VILTTIILDKKMPGANRAKRFIMTIAPYNILKPQIKLDWSLPALDPVAEVFASWARMIEFAPIENKLTLLFMMARDGATWADAHRQQAIDDVWYVAGELGLIDKFGTVHCQNILAAAFDRKIP